MVVLTLAHQVSSCRALPKVNVQTGCLATRSVVALVAAMEKAAHLGGCMSPNSHYHLHQDSVYTG